MISEKITGMIMEATKNKETVIISINNKFNNSSLPFHDYLF